MLRTHEIAELVEACTYKPGWSILLGSDVSGHLFIQLQVTEESDASLDSYRRDGTRTPWMSGKRFLSHHMCRQEIVGAVFGLFKDAETHEIHEWFRFRGASIFNPHLDPEALVQVARFAKNFNTRDNAMTMEEAGAPSLFDVMAQVVE